MEYIKNTTDFHIPENTVVSLGKFDGIHRGHGRLLEYLKEKKKTGLKTAGMEAWCKERQSTYDK